MRQQQVQNMGMEITTSQKLYYNWNEALIQSEKNPFPLAPNDLVRNGEVNEESYMNENKLLQEAGVRVMVPELLEITQVSDFEKGPKALEIFGAGLLRDMQWLRNPVTHLFNPVCITDCSTFACENAEKFKDLYSLPISILESDIGDAIACGYIDPEQTRVHYAGQLVQNLDLEGKNGLMKYFGQFLRIPTSKGKYGRKVYLLHARGEDNPLGSVEWKNTIAWPDKDLLDPLEEGFGGSVLMEIIGTHNHWNQRYVWFRLSAPPK